MKIKVTKDLCEIKENEIWNVGDYNVHTVQVELSPEFNGLVNKVRYFVEDNSYDMLITDNVAQVPYEATVMEGTIKIGVYGYDADTDILVQSTSPVNKYITSGTYTGDPDNTQPLTPTDKEQMETAIQKNTDDIIDLQNNKQNVLISGENIKTINNESILGSGNIEIQGGGGGSSDYTDLTNKPKINNVELNGNKSLNELGIQPAGNYLTEETDPTVPSHVKNITQADITSWDNKSNFSGNYNDLTNKPTNVSTFTNDAGYLTQHQDISGKENTSNKVTSISSSSTDIQYPSAKTVYDELTERDERITALENKSGHIYGIKRKITDNSNPSWERIKDNVGLVANATKNGDSVVNNFDDLAPWSDIKTCNYDLTTKRINAWFGDANFKFDGTNGDVFTYIPKTYWKIYQENDYDYVLLADYPKADFIEVDGFFVGRYNASVVTADGLLHTYSGLVPTVNETISRFRNLANALGSNFSQLDWRYFVLQMLYLVEYATYNSQSALGTGIQSRKNVKTIVAENNTNRAIIGNSSGYYVGQTIRIGVSDGSTSVCDGRKITAIDEYNDGTITGYALTFNGTAVDIAVNNFVCTMAQETGQCNDLGMKSGCFYNDGYHSVIYRGIENFFANIWQWVDGINISNRLVYICKDHSQYADDIFVEPYKALSYRNANEQGYIKTLGMDTDEPLIRFPIEIGGSSTTYITDYYHQSSGNAVARAGGSFIEGAKAGLWNFLLNYTSPTTYWNVGARVLIDDQEDI